MGEEKNYWQGLFEGRLNGTTVGLFSIMGEQCRNLESASGGRVHGRFEKLKYVTRTTGIAMADLLGGLNQTKETVEANSLSQTDASGLYEPSKYAFDIYSDTYKFRVFVADIGAAYPVTLDIDAGIYSQVCELLSKFSETGKSNASIRVDSDTQFAVCLETIVTQSEKLRYIIHKMAQEASAGTSHEEKDETM